MFRFAVAAVVVTACVVGCGYQVARVAGPADEDHFKTYCKRMEACLQDARDTCPGGFTKEGVTEGKRETELMFMCHGKASF